MMTRAVSVTTLAIITGLSVFAYYFHKLDLALARHDANKHRND
jgi:hypothetical protein